jgi:hypothetical protein
MPKKTSRARTAPPAAGQNGLLVLLRVVLAAVVFTVSVDVVVADAGLRLQVGESMAPEGAEVMAQVRLTVPLNPPTGLMVMLEVLPVVAPGLTLMAPLLESVKPEFTVTVTEVVWEATLAAVPLTVTV